MIAILFVLILEASILYLGMLIEREKPQHLNIRSAYTVINIIILTAILIGIYENN